MAAACGWVCLCLFYLDGSSLPDANEQPGLAAHLWEQGQAAMRRGQLDEAIAFYKGSLAADAGLQRNHLSLAAAYLEKKDRASACVHLAAYLDSHPDQLLVRSRYAELLVKLRRWRDARLQFEFFIAQAQEQGEALADPIINCHSRVVELAEKNEDAYCEHLHRGIGLYLLGCKRGALSDPEGELPAEGLLCKAAAELTLAHLQQPDEARPCWYLYGVWSRLNQRQPALCKLRQAESSAAFTYLTPSEQRELSLASQAWRTEGRR